MGNETLSIVISAYNEEGNVRELYRQLKEVVGRLDVKAAEIIFVDDGSADRTLFHCYEIQQADPSVKIVRLARNFGHEIAMTAGMDYAIGDAVVFMDADLQHPPAYIEEMVRLWRQGHEIVLTRRVDNADTGLVYKLMAKVFYKLLNFLSDIKITESAPDFRLIDRKYIDFLKAFDERDSMFRGMLSLIVDAKNENIAYIDFAAPSRLSGVSKYNFSKSLKLAFNSIMQFSVRPLQLSMWLAILGGAASLGLAGYVISERFILRNPTPGYATTVAAVGLVGSVILFVLAILGAYIGKIHIETKKRPLYLAEFLEIGGNGGRNGNGKPIKNASVKKYH